MFTRPACLPTMLAQAHANAAVKIINRPSTVVLPSVCTPITPMPAAAQASASHWKPCTFSCASRIASNRVNKTWVCTTREARPGEISLRMAK